MIKFTLSFLFIFFTFCGLLSCGVQNSDEKLSDGAQQANIESDASSKAKVNTPPEGEMLYNRYCFSCHASGIHQAPRVGHLRDWETRLAAGRDHMLQRVIDGIKPGMPPRGFCADCSDEQLDAILSFMLEQTGIDDFN